MAKEEKKNEDKSDEKKKEEEKEQEEAARLREQYLAADPKAKEVFSRAEELREALKGLNDSEKSKKLKDLTEGALEQFYNATLSSGFWRNRKENIKNFFRRFGGLFRRLGNYAKAILRHTGRGFVQLVRYIATTLLLLADAIYALGAGVVDLFFGSGPDLAADHLYDDVPQQPTPQPS